MAQNIPIFNFKVDRLDPVNNPDLARTIAVNLAQGTYLKGTVLGELSATPGTYAAYGGPPGVTLTATGAPTGGTFTVKINNGTATGTIAWNATASAVQTAIAALTNPAIGTGAVLAVGGPFPTNPITVYFSGAGVTPVLSAGGQSSQQNGLGNYTIGTNSLTGGTSPSVTFTPTVLQTNPAAPSVSAAGSSSIAAGAYNVAISYNMPGGETAISPATSVTLSGSNAARVAAITLPTGATSANIYMSGTIGSPVLQLAVAAWNGTQTDVTALPAVDAPFAPLVNNGYIKGDGSQIARGLLAYSCSVDANGNISFGDVITGYSTKTAELYIRGEFATQDINTAGVGGNNLDMLAIAQMSALLERGTLLQGIVRLD